MASLRGQAAAAGNRSRTPRNVRRLSPLHPIRPSQRVNRTKSPLNRRARYYSLTPAGRRQLEREESLFEEMVRGITRVLRTV